MNMHTSNNVGYVYVLAEGLGLNVCKSAKRDNRTRKSAAPKLIADRPATLSGTLSML